MNRYFSDLECVTASWNVFPHVPSDTPGPAACVTGLKALQSCLEKSLNFEVLNDFTVASWAFFSVRGSICSLSLHVG